MGVGGDIGDADAWVGGWPCRWGVTNGSLRLRLQLHRRIPPGHAADHRSGELFVMNEAQINWPMSSAGREVLAAHAGAGPARAGQPRPTAAAVAAASSGARSTPMARAASASVARGGAPIGR